jgi:hypothetical protein
VLFIRTIGLITLNFVVYQTLGYSYPNFIGLGYKSCLTCHYNPFGNGPLNDYGRALGAVAVSDRLFRDTETTDETLGKNSGFFYSKPSNTWFRPSVDYRGLYLRRGHGTTYAKNKVIHMMANTTLVLKYGKGDRFIAVADFGYAPDPIPDVKEEMSNFRSREHYIGHRSKSFGIYAGAMDKVFGLRVPDHTSFSRTIPGVNQNDQSHGVMAHFHSKNFDFGIHGFVGNLAQKKSLRQKGLSTQFERSLGSQTRIGASFLSSSSDYLGVMASALHLRSGYGKGSSIMIELGGVQKETLANKNKQVSSYLFLQNHLALKRGIFAIGTFEALNPNTDLKYEILRWGPGIQYFPLQGIELRADFYNTRVLSKSSISEDTWDLTGQVHVWF